MTTASPQKRDSGINQQHIRNDNNAAAADDNNNDDNVVDDLIDIHAHS